MIKREELANLNSCMNRAKDDEMTFVLLGRDKATPFTIRAWVKERIRLGKNVLQDEQIQRALLDATFLDGQDPAIEVTEVAGSAAADVCDLKAGHTCDLHGLLDKLRKARR